MCMMYAFHKAACSYDYASLRTQQSKISHCSTKHAYQVSVYVGRTAGIPVALSALD